MKKSTLYITLSFVLSICLLCIPLAIEVTAADWNEENFVDQTAAIQANQKLWSIFELDESGMPISYPYDYAGDYVVGNVLHIKLTEMNNDRIAFYYSLCGDQCELVFESAEYSLNYLQNLINEVNEIRNDFNLSGYGLDIIGNCISAETYSDKSIMKLERSLRNFLQSDAINLVRSTQSGLTSTNLIGGAQVTGYGSNGLQKGTFSLGICGTYNGNPSVLTAGHCVSEENGSGIQDVSLVKLNGTTLGSPVAFQYKDEENGDWAVIEITNLNYSISNTIYCNSFQQFSVTGFMTSYLTGQFVSMYGSASGTNVGILNSYNYTHIPRDAYNNDLCKVHGMCSVSLGSGLQTLGGDSGGPVYCQIGGNNYYLGTISGYHNTPGVNYAVYSPIGLASSSGFLPKTS